jgi:hypothetical protein
MTIRISYPSTNQRSVAYEHVGGDDWVIAESSVNALTRVSVTGAEVARVTLHARSDPQAWIENTEKAV